MTYFIAGFLAFATAGQFDDFEPPDAPTIYVSGSVDLRQQFTRFDSLVEQKLWNEAVDLIQELIEKQGNSLAESSPGSSVHVSVRALCDRRIANLPEEGLARYRSRVDGQAAALWKQWEDSRDIESVQGIAKRFLCSSFGDRAIAHLGDRALSTGSYAQALHYWSMVLPKEVMPNQHAMRLPNPKVDQARILAKCAIAYLLSGDIGKAGGIRQLLTDKYADAKGSLAGQEGKYFEIIAALLKSKDFEPPRSSGDWPTFAGDPTRSKEARQAVRVGGVQFEWDLRGDENRANQQAEQFAPVAPRFPIAIGDDIYAATTSHVWRGNLATGRIEKVFDLGGNNREPENVRYTLTAQGNKLYAVSHEQGERRLGRPRRRFMPRRIFPTYNSSVFCFDLSTQKKLWEAKGSELFEDQGVMFEGTPIATPTGVYVGVTRYDTLHRSYVAKLDPNTGKLVWMSSICESMADGPTDSIPMYNMLTLAGSTVYCCTNLGAIAAIDVDTGSPIWIATYQRRWPALSGPQGDSEPDLNPCVVEGGRLFALPRDSRSVICLESTTGEQLWESASISGFVHMLGVAKDRLIVTGSQVTAIETRTGKVAWIRPLTKAPGFGRGMIADGEVYWPTRMDIHVFNVVDGQRTRPPIDLFGRFHLKPGNLLAAAGRLIISQPDRMVVLSPASMLIERLRLEIVANPNAAEPRFRMGEFLELQSKWEEAAAAFEAAGERAHENQAIDGKPLKDASNARRFQSVLALADSVPPEKSVEIYASARKIAPSLNDQLQTVINESRRASSAGRMKLARMVLDDPKLRATTYKKSPWQSESGAVWATAMLREIKNSDEQIFEQYEEDARSALTALADKSTTALLELASRFPACTAQQSILLEVARARSAKGEFDIARDVFMQVVQSTTESNPVHAEALAGAADCLLATKEKEAEYFLRCQRARIVANAPWPKQDFDSSSLRGGEGHPLNGGLRYVAQGSTLGGRPFIATSKQSFGPLQLNWQSGMPAKTISTLFTSRPSWLGRTPWGLVVAVDGRIECFDENNAQRRWMFAYRESSPFKPTASARTAPQIVDSPTRFLVAGDTVLVASENDLVGLSAIDGTPRWRLGSSEAATVRWSLAGSLACAVSDDRLLAMVPATGQKILEVDLAAGVAGRLPICVDATFIVVKERSKIAAFDERTGKHLWDYTLSMPAFAPPRLGTFGSNLIALIDGYRVDAIDARTGTERWHRTLHPRPRADRNNQIIADENSVFICAAEKLASIKGSDGSLNWERALPGGAFEQPNNRLVREGEFLLVQNLAGERIATLAAETGNTLPD